MVDVKKLKEEMALHKITVDELANQIGIDRTTLYRRFSNDGDTFTVKEVNSISKILKLSINKSRAIFFGTNVADMRN
ncbi:helix-turn-helix domain-containing protein [Bulleidia extructa]|uniref:helix-turn-helix domain-containing protein n=1 Tax=Bulleidia extructa TaxID=118748 RepID=UPI00058D483F|nr:helix-turn-helix transcriptional regulator [Bulleidia extructa]